MELPSLFEDRLRRMEKSRNEQILLLKAEKEVQKRKERFLSAKIAALRSVERRCLLLEKRRADLRSQILANRAKIEAGEERRRTYALVSRDMKKRIMELEEREKATEGFYATKTAEIGAFKDLVRRRLMEARSEVQKLRLSVAELRSTLKERQELDGCTNNPKVTEAERRKEELLASERSLQTTLNSNIQLRSSLQKQLRKLLSLATDGRQTPKS